MKLAYAEVIGDPIAHSKSPIIHKFWLEQCGIAADYRKVHVTADGLASYFAQRRGDPEWRGCNVTIPHKLAVLAMADGVDGSAAGVGAANMIFRGAHDQLVAANTDVDGIAEAIAGAAIGDHPVVLIGAGGAARAAMACLAAQGSKNVRVIARNAEKARAIGLQAGIAVTPFGFDSAAAALEHAALVVNATQLGMADEEAMPASVLAGLDRVATDALVFDMVYVPIETALLARARASGRMTVDGLTMLIGQAAKAFERFFGMAPPRDGDAELRARLIA